MDSKEALKMIQKHIKDIDELMARTVDRTNMAILHEAKSTALLSLAKILVG